MSISELVRGVRLALQNSGLDDCQNLDRNDNGAIEIGELVAAVGSALRGCFYGQIIVDQSRLCFEVVPTSEIAPQTIEVRRFSGRWSAEVTADWLRLDRRDGDVPGPIQVTVDPSGLMDGHHRSEIELTDSSGALETVSVDLNLYSLGETDGWILQNVSSVGRGAERTSLALDPNGAPGISFFRDDEETNKEIWYAQWEGCGWRTELVDRGFSSSIAFDSSGRPHIAFNSQRLLALRYAVRNDDGWEVISVDLAEGGVTGFRPSLILDSSDRAHISHQIKAGLFDLRYTFFDGVEWFTETVDADRSTGWDSSIVLGPDEAPRIAYHTDGSGAILYAQLIDDEWTFERVGSGGKPSSLRIDSSGNAMIAHHSLGSVRALEFASRQSDGEWIREEVDRQGRARLLAYVSLALDSFELPHIAYVDFDEHALKYASLNDTGEWLIEVIHQDEALDIGDLCSLQIDSRDVAHISYLDLTTGILKYARGPAVPADH